MGELKYFLGLQVKQSRDDIFLSQEKYIKKLLKIFDMDRLKAKITPMSPLTKVTQDKTKVSINEKRYRYRKGSLFYITASCPIMFSLCLCTRSQANSKESYVKYITRIFQYIKNT